MITIKRIEIKERYAKKKYTEYIEYKTRTTWVPRNTLKITFRDNAKIYNITISETIVSW